MNRLPREGTEENTRSLNRFRLRPESDIDLFLVYVTFLQPHCSE
jgi:hypothetical protein